VSPRALPRQGRLSWPAPRESEPPAGADRSSWLVGKQSTTSNRNASRSITFLAELSCCLCVLHRLGTLPSPPQQDVHLSRLPCAGQIRSALLRLLRSYSKTSAARSIDNFFVCNEYSLILRSTALTRDCSGRKISPPRGRSKHTALSKSPNGPIAGSSPENVESSI